MWDAGTMESRADTERSPTVRRRVSSGSPPDVVGAAAIRGRVRRDRGDLDGRSAIAKRAQRFIGRFVVALGGAARD